LKKILLALLPLAVLASVSIAQAEPVQEFSFQLKDVKPDGRFTVVFTSRTFDTTGAIPPLLRENYLRLPLGSKLSPKFLNRRYYCDGQKLLSSLQENPDTSVKFYKRVENLKALEKKLKGPSDRKRLQNLKVCERAKVGQGVVQVDARPFINELIPAKIYLFFGKGTVKNAIASFWIIGVPDENAAIVRNTPVVRDTRVAIASNFFNDPTPDGKYGYRLQLPAGPIGGINISVAEVNVTTKGLTLLKKKVKCLKRKHGKCAKRRVTRTRYFWFTRPTCPPSGQLSFLAFYGYDDPTPDITKQITLPCPRFRG
jgi:hypothetical protein